MINQNINYDSEFCGSLPLNQTNLIQSYGILVVKADNKKYHPRNSFRQWQEKLSGFSIPWQEEQIRMAELLRTFLFDYKTSVV